MPRWYCPARASRSAVEIGAYSGIDNCTVFLCIARGPRFPTIKAALAECVRVIVAPEHDVLARSQITVERHPPTGKAEPQFMIIRENRAARRISAGREFICGSLYEARRGSVVSIEVVPRFSCLVFHCCRSFGLLRKCNLTRVSVRQGQRRRRCATITIAGSALHLVLHEALLQK